MRLAVYLDYVHRREGSRVYAPRAFALFVAGLRAEFDGVVVAGRVDPEPGRSHYALPDDVEFLDLPHYASAADPRGLAKAIGGGLRRWDAAIRGVDVVWVLGPQGLALPFALLALARGKRVVLGVRQDLPAYARSRHPGRRLVHAAADALDGAFRALARLIPVVVVGPALAERYRAARAVLPLTVSLISERELDAPAPERRWDGELTAISVGRLEEEKNPLLLADVLADLRASDPRWRLVICGEGPLEERPARAPRGARRGRCRHPARLRPARRRACRMPTGRRMRSSTCRGRRACRRSSSRRSRLDCRSWRRRSAASPRRGTARCCWWRRATPRRRPRGCASSPPTRRCARRSWRPASHRVRAHSLEAELRADRPASSGARRLAPGHV